MLRSFRSFVPRSIHSHLILHSVDRLNLIGTILVLLLFVRPTLLQSETPSFASPTVYDSGGAMASSVAIADVNGDGKPDLVVANRCTHDQDCRVSSIAVLLGNGDGTFQAAHIVGYNGEFVAIADMNGDGKPDIVTATYCTPLSYTCDAGGAVGILLGNGDGTFQNAVYYGSGGYGALSVSVEDVNGDGKPDVLVANYSVAYFGPSNGALGVLLNNGDGTLRSAVTYPVGSNPGSALAVADLDRDGKPDVVFASSCPTYNACDPNIAVLKGNGDGTFQIVSSYSSGGFMATSVSIGDVNGDGNPDVVVSNSVSCTNLTNCPAGTGAVGVLLGNGDGTFLPPATYATGGSGADFVTISDVNSDGHPDLVVFNGCGTTSCTGGGVGVLLGNGDGTFQTAVSYSSGIGYSYPGAVEAADLNADGSPDIAIAQGCLYDSDCLSVLLNNAHPPTATGTINVTTNSSGASFTVTGPASFTGNGISATFNNAPIGAYTITFAPFSGYVTPTVQTGVLSAGQTLTFNAQYTPLTGTITINSDLTTATFTLNPSIAGAPTGGPYPVVLQDAFAGEYSITFSPVQGYVTPSLPSELLTTGGSISFTADYAPLPQVLIVPGIFGTKLASQNDPNPSHCPAGDPSCIQWLSNSKITESYIDKILGVDAPGAFSVLQYDSNGNPIEPLALANIFNFVPNATGNSKDLLDCNSFPLSSRGGCQVLGREINVYDTLRDDLQQAGFTVSSFPYDWREDLPSLGDQLYAAISALIQEYPQQRLALVAHSMGGLVVSEMLARHPDVASSLSNIVTLGTPFAGSAKAYLQLQGWESLEPDFLSTTGTKELGQYWASPYFLLPQEDFVTDFETDSTGKLVSNSAVYQGQFMPALFPALPRQAILPDTSFGSAAPKTLAIIGSGYLTTTRIQTINSIGTNAGSTSMGTIGLSSTCKEFVPENGDGTVSVASASSQSSGITQELFVNDEHELLPSNDAVIGAIINFLSGVAPTTTEKLQTQPFPPPITWDATVCSPVDLSAQASNGRSVANGLIDVPGASYISSPDGTQITVPGTDQYELQLRGTGVGTFTLILTERSMNLAVLQSTVFANIPVAPSLTGYLSVTPNTVGSLQLNIGSTTLTLAPETPLTVADNIKILSAIVPTMQLSGGISISLLAKLNAASDAIARGDANAAAGVLGAFVNEVQAQAGETIPPSIASGLLSITKVIEGLLPPPG